jgi:regulator of protease activity HflC (stomatin/prohibitin superfamily)
MTDMISQVLEPLVSSYFRNAAQEINALNLYTKRAELAASAKEQISSVLAHYHIESRDVMITDVILPKEVTAPVNAAAIAKQEKEQYIAQKDAQESRKDLEKIKKEADMQQELVASERGIIIAENDAQAAVKKATGERDSAVLAADGRAQTVTIEADAQAHKVKAEGEAEASITKLKGEAEGAAIEAKGTAQATAYKLSQEALGADYARLQIIEAIAKNGLKIIPENIFIGGGSDGGGLINQFLGIEMIEKLTGKPFNKDNSTTEKSQE